MKMNLKIKNKRAAYNIAHNFTGGFIAGDSCRV